ncbi:MAG: hypothetical protein V1650_04620 [Candidatus Omnitrophota bacterium]
MDIKKIFIGSMFFILLISFIPAFTRAEGIKDVSIEGLVLEKVKQGKVVYSIKSEKAVFANKRIGFFDIGFSKIIILENIQFVLYDNGKVVKAECFEHAVYDVNSRQLLDEKGKVIFNEYTK